MLQSLNAGLSLTQKSLKPKKQEKKKLTPKPQITAKVVQKTTKPKKSGENKKNSSLNALRATNLLMDPAFWASAIKPAAEPKSSDPTKSGNISGAQMYAEMLRTAALSVKQREQMEKKIVDQMAMKSVIDQLKTDIGHKLVNEAPIKSNPGFYQYPKFPGDLTKEKYKQLLASYWNNPAFAGNLYSHFQNAKKNKAKAAKQQSVLKPSVQKSESVKPEESKTKTNFNIEDILGKPSITVTTKNQSSSSSTLIKSIEEKIKSISKEVNITKCSSSQVINLSSGRKNVAETVKRAYSDTNVENVAAVKKICRGPDQPSSSKKDEIEVVIIDD